MPFLSFPVNAVTEVVPITLLSLWGVLLFGGFGFGLLRQHQPVTLSSSSSRIPRELRLASSLCLAVAAWIWLHHVRGFQSSELVAAFTLWFALGASLSCLGDFISLLVNAAHAQLVSLLVFMTAHVAYISGMVGLIANSVHGIATQADYNPLPLFLMIGAVWVWIIIGMVVWYFWIYRRGDVDAMHATPLTYAILVSVTAGMATALTLYGSNFILLAIGAGLIWFSELIITPLFLRHQQSDQPWPLLGDLVWLTHGPGQMLLVFGIAINLLLLPSPFIYGFM